MARVMTVLGVIAGWLYLLASVAIPATATVMIGSHFGWDQVYSLFAGAFAGLLGLSCTIVLLFHYAALGDRIAEMPWQKFWRVAPTIVAPALAAPVILVLFIIKMVATCSVIREENQQH